VHGELTGNAVNEIETDDSSEGSEADNQQSTERLQCMVVARRVLRVIGPQSENLKKFKQA